MNEIQRMQHLAGIVAIDEDVGEEVTKTAIGHTDDEVQMLKKSLFQMGTYCVELYKLLDKMPDDADFPHWLQAKLVKAQDYISTSKHYLENEINVPDDQESTVTPDAQDFQDPSGVS